MSARADTRDADSARLAERARQGAQASTGRLHWESWLLRVLLLVAVIGQAVSGNGDGARVAGIGLAFSLAPPLIDRFSKGHVPASLEFAFVGAMTLQFLSESFKLFELFTYWDKIVHPVEIFLATGIVTFLFLGYRRVEELKDLPDTTSAAGAMMCGIALGATWELVEFGADWFGNANLQKSNADSMTDILTNNAGAIFGTLAFFWWYRHRLHAEQKDAFGHIAHWLTHGAQRLLERHGRLIGALVALFFAAVITAGWLMDRRPLPRPSAAPPAGPLLGAWDPSEPTRGACLATPEGTPPGSEKMGLLALARRAGEGKELTVAVPYLLTRPALGEGTAMSAGIAFGLRDPDNFYVLRADATHDIVALDRYIHGVKRQQREEHRLSRGDEWHELRLAVSGGTVAADIDGQRVFEEEGLEATEGGLALWARATSSACFGEVRIDAG